MMRKPQQSKKERFQRAYSYNQPMPNESAIIMPVRERILRTMANQGAHLVASGVDMKRALKQHIFAAVCRAMSDIPANS
jgi:hypothetical protein